MRRYWYVGLVLGLTCASTVVADPPHGSYWSLFSTQACPSVGCCPDDYVRKPYPHIAAIPCGGRDDYDHKPLPCVKVPRGGGPDDYDCKTMPTLVCPPRSANLQCGPSEPGSSGHGQHPFWRGWP